MGRILCIDYGRRRCGIAVTDPLRITANGLPTVPAATLMDFLKEYCPAQGVDLIVMGLPTQLNGEPSESMRYIEPFMRRLKKEMPQMPVEMHDERFTSTIAHREMIAAGFKKKDRQRKELADEMAAVLILNGYLDSISLKAGRQFRD